jgi:hypothetical protein
MPAVDHFHDSFRRPKSRDHNALARRRPGASVPVPVRQPRRRQNRSQNCQHPFASFVHKRILTYSPFLRLAISRIIDDSIHFPGLRSRNGAWRRRQVSAPCFVESLLSAPILLFLNVLKCSRRRWK